MEVGIERLISAVATEERNDVAPRESAAASKRKYGRELWTDKNGTSDTLYL